jgi:hypothetical protein
LNLRQRLIIRCAASGYRTPRSSTETAPRFSFMFFPSSSL